MEQRAADCSPLLRSVLYHYNKTPWPERPVYVANLVQARDRCLAGGALGMLSANKQTYVLRQAGWVSLLADEPLHTAEAFFAASSDLLPVDLRENNLVVYVKNALLYLTRLVNHQYREAQAVRLSPAWQHRAGCHWRTVNHLLRHAAGVRRPCADLLRDPGPHLDTLALTELRELMDQGLTGVALFAPNDPDVVRLRRQLAALPGNKDTVRAPDNKMSLSVIMLSMAAVACTSWLLWSVSCP